MRWDRCVQALQPCYTTCNADARRSGLPQIALRGLQPEFGKLERALERIQIQAGCFSSYLEAERCCCFILVLSGRKTQIVNMPRNARRLSRIGRGSWEYRGDQTKRQRSCD